MFGGGLVLQLLRVLLYLLLAGLVWRVSLWVSVWLGVVCVFAHLWALVLQLRRVCLVGLWLFDWFVIFACCLLCW